MSHLRQSLCLDPILHAQCACETQKREYVRSQRHKRSTGRLNCCKIYIDLCFFLTQAASSISLKTIKAAADYSREHSTDYQSHYSMYRITIWINTAWINVGFTSTYMDKSDAGLVCVVLTIKSKTCSYVAVVLLWCALVLQSWHIMQQSQYKDLGESCDNFGKECCVGNLTFKGLYIKREQWCLSTTWTEPRPTGDSLEVAWCADVRLGQLLLLPLGLFLPLGEGVRNVVHLRVVMVTLMTADLGVFDVDGSHGQRRSLKRWHKDTSRGMQRQNLVVGYN